MHLEGVFGLFFWNAPYLDTNKVKLGALIICNQFSWYELQRLKIYIYLTISQAVKEENE